MKRDSQITTALGQCAASVKRTGSGQWELTLSNGKPLGVSARLLENWLVLAAPITQVSRDGWWDLLRLNRNIRGLSKFVMASRQLALTGSSSAVGPYRETGACSLRADIPLVQEDDEAGGGEIAGVLTTRLLDTCADLKSGFRDFSTEIAGDHKAPIAREGLDENVEQRVHGLRRLCGDTAWPFIERSAGMLMVDLDVRSGFYQAAVERREAGVAVSVEIIRSAALSETSRHALGLLLLGTGTQVRLARPCVEESGKEIGVRFEVTFATTPVTSELSHAFAALSVACTLAGREAKALQDEGIARTYLGMLGAPEATLASLDSDREKKGAGLQERSL